MLPIIFCFETFLGIAIEATTAVICKNSHGVLFQRYHSKNSVPLTYAQLNHFIIRLIASYSFYADRGSMIASNIFINSILSTIVSNELYIGIFILLYAEEHIHVV